MAEKQEKQVIIQQKIDEVMQKEFEKLIKESSKDPLIRLLLENKLSVMPIKDMKNYLKRESIE